MQHFYAKDQPLNRDLLETVITDVDAENKMSQHNTVLK